MIMSVASDSGRSFDVFLLSLKRIFKGEATTGDSNKVATTGHKVKNDPIAAILV